MSPCVSFQSHSADIGLAHIEEGDRAAITGGANPSLHIANSGGQRNPQSAKSSVTPECLFSSRSIDVEHQEVWCWENRVFLSTWCGKHWSFL